MSLLKKDSTRVGFRLVGVEVPPRTFSYLSLYCCAIGVTKAKLFKTLIIEWMTKQKEEESDAKLLQRILKRAQTQANISRRKDPTFNLDEFKTKLKEELTNKGIIENYVELIIKEIE